MIKLEQQYKRAANVEALELDGEWVILHADQFTVTRVNEVGGLCWTLLQQPRSVRELTEEVLQSYEITVEEAERDIEAFAQELYRIGLVEHAD